MVVAKTQLPATSLGPDDALDSPPSLATIAQLAGYYDQSHLVRDVREFAGATPKQLLSRSR
jgi:AraC-like DNA-binding protein